MSWKVETKKYKIECDGEVINFDLNGARSAEKVVKGSSLRSQILVAQGYVQRNGFAAFDESEIDQEISEDLTWEVKTDQYHITCDGEVLVFDYYDTEKKEPVPADLTTPQKQQRYANESVQIDGFDEFDLEDVQNYMTPTHTDSGLTGFLTSGTFGTTTGLYFGTG